MTHEMIQVMVFTYIVGTCVTMIYLSGGFTIVEPVKSWMRVFGISLLWPLFIIRFLLIGLYYAIIELFTFKKVS